MIRLTVHLCRDSFETPWGFRLQGGKDLNQPLTVQRVFTNSPAEGELQRGDVILTINGRDASSFTHKQALDQIKFGGGQIDLVVDRPPSGRIHIKPITPHSPTRAPSLPSPTKVFSVSPILFPSRSQPSGPPSPTKSAMPPPQGAGFSPKKVTLNKLGGGGLNFGTDFVQGHKPQAVTSPPVTTSRAYDATDYASRSTAPDDRGVAEEEYPAVEDRKRAFMKNEPYVSPHIEYDEDDYPTSPVRVRQKLFSEGESKAVRSSGKKVVLSTPSQPSQPVPAFGFDYTKPRPYQPPSKPQAPSTAPKPASKQPEPVKSAVQTVLLEEHKQTRGQDKPDTGPAWGSTLKTEKRDLKPWEKEQFQLEEFNKKQARGFQPDFDDTDASPSYQSPRQNIIQIKTQSTARQRSASKPHQQQQQQQQQQKQQQTYQPQHQAPVQRSVSPAVPPKSTRSPARSPQPYQAPHESIDAAGYYQGRGVSAPTGVVHLQYNSPIGLYSQDNIKETLIGQTMMVNRPEAAPSAPAKPAVPGDRDWNQSYVYKMLHEEKKTERQVFPGSQQEPVRHVEVKTRDTCETRRPGEEPHRTVKETYSTSALPPRLDEALGMSDF